MAIANEPGLYHLLSRGDKPTAGARRPALTAGRLLVRGSPWGALQRRRWAHLNGRSRRSSLSKGRLLRRLSASRRRPEFPVDHDMQAGQANGIDGETPERQAIPTPPSRQRLADRLVIVADPREADQAISWTIYEKQRPNELR
jgi:hypothetical protein